MRARRTRSAILSGAFLVVVILFGSFANVQADVASKESLERVAAQYWDLRMGGKFEETYKMEDGKDLPPFKQYQTKAGQVRSLNIASHKVRDVSIKGSKGTVTMLFFLSVKEVKKPLPSPLTDSWVAIDGKWRHVFK